MSAYVPNRPVTRTDPACFDCGVTTSPDYGSVFTQPAADGATAYWFDRDQRRFAVTTRAARVAFGSTIVVHGRSFVVRDWTDAAKAERAARARVAAIAARNPSAFAASLTVDA